MKNYVVTGINDAYFSTWGLSWLISLKEFGKHSPEDTIVIGFNLSSRNIDKIKSMEVQYLEGNFSGDYRFDIYKKISEIANEGNYAYWDADVYFQDDISEVFNNKLSITQNPGFVVADTNSWKQIGEYLNIAEFVQLNKSKSFEILSNIGDSIDSSWNFTDIPNLRDVNGKLCLQNQIIKVVHPYGSIKKLLNGKKILFWERYPNFLSVQQDTKRITPRFLKSVVHK